MLNYFEKRWISKNVQLILIFQFSLTITTLAQTVRHPNQVGKPRPLQEVPASPNPYAEIDKKALLIPDSLTKSTDAISSFINANFHTSQDRVRAAFIWVASSIKYDVPNMYAINYYEKKEDKIDKPLQTRKGICENYASLLADICQKIGIQCFVVEGYVKLNNHVSDLSHAWCVAQVDTSWYLYDPTWASGYVNNGIFVPKINNSFYQPNSSNFIQTHMPFDRLWQLLYYPINFTDFNDGTVKENTEMALFSFPDSIAQYEKQNLYEKYQSSYARIDNNGVKNSQIFNRLLFIRQSMEEIKTNDYNAAVADYNNAINNFNQFIHYRNKQFIPMRPDVEIQAMLDSATNPYILAKNKINMINNPGPNILSLIGPLQKQMNDFSQQLEEQKIWLAKYLSKGKSGRKGMFTKVTWFGIPLN